MCGIFGLVAKDNIIDILVSGLQKLEYRGYDSSGIAVLDSKDSKDFIITKSQGKIVNLKHKIFNQDLKANIGIAHTRWATHGRASEVNAHPHYSKNFAIVHNGIIENYKALKKELQASGCKFYSDTDTEVIPHIIEKHYNKSQNIIVAIRAMMQEIEGAFALAILYKEDSQSIFIAKRGSPLAIGQSKEVNFISSDAYAMSEYVDKVAYLEDDEIAQISCDNIIYYDDEGNNFNKEMSLSNFTMQKASKENYRHFMLKEINEQSSVAADIMNAYCSRSDNNIKFPKITHDFSKIKNISFVACGSSYYASLIAKNWFENIANINCKVEIASEFIYNSHYKNSDLVIFISQSGETADSLKALKMVKESKIATLLLTNVEHSSMALSADYIINLLAGPEIGVASTKAFTAQLIILALMALKIADNQQRLEKEKLQEYCRELRKIPTNIGLALQQENQISKVANLLKNINNILYLGRGVSYGLAQEGALKLKELSYIHAEAIALGELKHGPIALIDENLFIVSLLINDKLVTKSISNLQEVKARDGKIIIITDEEIKDKISDIATEVILMPKGVGLSAPIIYSLPIQLLAYHVALLKGTDVDQPRNLAKSVTVE
jgi:glucosamine--fructose-6-phosphate aminotransferase (isomerizing)